MPDDELLFLRAVCLTTPVREIVSLTGLAPVAFNLFVDFVIPTGDVSYGNVVIDEDACTTCELCARFCPTEALRFHEHKPITEKPDDHPAFELSFRPSLCLDCNICVFACPEETV